MKAAFVCAGVVEVRSSQSLAEQLSRYGSGFELKTVSSIPQGSGKPLSHLTVCVCVCVCATFFLGCMPHN